MIIVTSGHVDHGKTALLQALTGTHTAHLPEEKKRGMTIDLGYAYLPLADSDKILGFIDVPGHEKFLANMLAGLGGIHYAMLIVAADEGIAAQTKEHLAMLRLLGLTEIIVVITKSDRADSSQITQLKTQITQDYPFLSQARFFITSALHGQGITALRQYLAELPNLAQPEKPFRYAIDRVFSAKGAGTVVTGTAFAGKVKVGDELYLSSGQKVRVKKIHAQNKEADIGLAGQRLALNINVDLDRTSVVRGDWLFAQHNIQPTDRLTVVLETEVSLQESQSVHIYHSASRTTGKLTLLTKKNTRQNDRTFAELILNKPLFLTFGDRLILRSGDAKLLIGGAKVLDVYSPKRHKRSDERLSLIAALDLTEQTAQRIPLYLRKNALEVAKLMWIEQLTESQLTALLAQTNNIRFEHWCFNVAYQQQQTQQILTALSDYHQHQDDQIGVSKARLYRMAALHQPEKLIYHFIDSLLEKGLLQQTRGWLHLAEHKIQFSTEEYQLWEWVLSEFEKAQGQPLWVRDIATILRRDESEVRNFMYKSGKLGYLTPIVKDRFFLTETLYTYARLIKQILAEQESLSVNELRDRLGFGRKLTVQLIEFFDRSGLLRRRGNEHFLRDKDTFDL
ncbi:selenocysteine-specific translation elongation factor [Rodentibacter caecimuris]|uniref:Selenocysteine-specific elongation factor n=1 Tax=Rodentibacter caecimuris TaxID=1796644 RepID=A0ABX3L1V0_9PAST|nr:selenocysteine-specific translation elongation factor [Rodentibacter heylii]